MMSTTPALKPTRESTMKECLFIRPELLTHPNIPKPLHGINPRSMLGKQWWDEKRREAYRKNNLHCWACGTHKYDASYHQWLEGHENYSYDYETGCLELIEIVALCHACHNFIHSSRLNYRLGKKEISHRMWHEIMTRGFKILQQAELRPWWGTMMTWLVVHGWDARDALRFLIDEGKVAEEDVMAGAHIPWGQWHMIIEGDAYYSKFKTMNDWKAHYDNKKPQSRRKKQGQSRQPIGGRPTAWDLDPIQR